MKNTVAVIIYYIVMGIIAVVSALSWLGTLVSIANVDMFGTPVVQMLAVSTLVVAGTYCVSFVVSLIVTCLKKKMNFWSFLPIIHIVVFIIFLALWLVTEQA